MPKWIKDSVGELRRLWFEDDEIEDLAAAELLKFKKTLQPPLDLETLAEQHFNIALDQYATMDANTLGCTVFESDGSVRILMNRTLTTAMERESDRLSVVGRWRATLAHELGHVLLHRRLYQHHERQIDLLPETQERSGIECLRRDVGADSRAADWKEVQANKAMAAFLMPAGAVVTATERNLKTSQDSYHLILVDRIAQEFLVSRQMAIIRLRDLGLPKPSAKLF